MSQLLIRNLFLKTDFLQCVHLTNWFAAFVPFYRLTCHNINIIVIDIQNSTGQLPIFESSQLTWFLGPPK